MNKKRMIIALTIVGILILTNIFTFYKYKNVSNVLAGTNTKLSEISAILNDTTLNMTNKEEDIKKLREEQTNLLTKIDSLNENQEVLKFFIEGLVDDYNVLYGDASEALDSSYNVKNLNDYISYAKEYKTLPDGEYKLINNGYSLGYNKDNIEIIKNNNQYLRIQNIKKDNYLFFNKNGKVLTLSDDELSYTEFKNQENQIWQIIIKEDSKYQLKNIANKKTIEMTDNGYVISDDTIYEITSEKYTPLGNFEYFSQLDSRWSKTKYSWSNVRNAGCGPTALTMIINYLDERKIEPPEIYKISVDNKLDKMESPRTKMPELLELMNSKYDYNFNYKIIDKERVLEELDNGNIVLMATRKNYKINYTNTEHYLVLIGYDNIGNIIVFDPFLDHSFDMPIDKDNEWANKGYVYVAKPENLFYNLTEAYSLWGIK